MKLSIVIPAYNEARTIQTVLDRVNQSLDGFHEIVVVDDASKDETAALVKMRADADPRIRLLQHKRNAGKTAALRTGFAAITGDVVVIAGDVFHSVRPTNTAIVFAFHQFARLAQALPQAAIVVIVIGVISRGIAIFRLIVDILDVGTERFIDDVIEIRSKS